MRIHRTLGTLSLCFLGSGCYLWSSTAYNLGFEASRAVNDCAGGFRDRRVAEKAWVRAKQASPESHFSEDYARGFMDGFTDYVEGGGTGFPPPVPPPPYWKARYQTPAGHAAVDDWYSGFAHGAAEARASGLRHLVTVPSSLPPAAPGDRAAPVPSAEPAAAPVLPAPRPAPPAAAHTGEEPIQGPSPSPPPSAP